MKPVLSCYLCGCPASTREHIPPRSFFLRAEGLQLKTIPSCVEHNNAKSSDDQYVLAQICIGASYGKGLPREIFNRSIAPQLTRSPAFRELLVAGSKTMPDGSRLYKVDIARFDKFFDHLAAGLFFDRYQRILNRAKYSVGHVYPDLYDEDSEGDIMSRQVVMMLGHLFAEFKDKIVHYEADRIDELVYMYRIMDPFGPEASITIVHTFYGLFDVVTFLTHRIENSYSDNMLM